MCPDSQNPGTMPAVWGPGVTSCMARSWLPDAHRLVDGLHRGHPRPNTPVSSTRAAPERTAAARAAASRSSARSGQPWLAAALVALNISDPNAPTRSGPVGSAARRRGAPRSAPRGSAARRLRRARDGVACAAISRARCAECAARPTRSGIGPGKCCTFEIYTTRESAFVIISKSSSTRFVVPFPPCERTSRLCFKEPDPAYTKNGVSMPLFRTASSRT